MFAGGWPPLFGSLKIFITLIGRVTDYRITDLGEMMKLNRLAPFFGESKVGIDDPIDKASQRLKRYALFCPMTISNTIILNMAAVMPLYSLILKEEMSEDNLVGVMIEEH